jgi:crotonobetainyl-CoA:carnitine CoA-transferase CaiB-like acyl-CoA transferase
LQYERWNRGKRSLALDLRKDEGLSTFLEAAKVADVVIDGLRPGTLNRLRAGWEVLREVNRSLIYCALSGMGQTGPYRQLGLHGAGSDAAGAVAPVAFDERDRPFIGPHVSIGTRQAPMYAFAGALAALLRVWRGKQGGSYVDIGQFDVAAYSRVDDWVEYLNTGNLRPTTPFKGMARNQYYRTADGRYVLFQPFEQKFWERFCAAVNREDLRGGLGSDANSIDMGQGNEALREELGALFASRPLDEWLQLFLETGIPGAPVNDIESLMTDPQFSARDNVYVAATSSGELQMPTTPIKVAGQQFGVGKAPRYGEHSDEVLREWLAIDDDTLKALHRDGVVSQQGEESLKR